MEQFTFNEIIDRIMDKLTESDEDTITSIYNQLFEIPVVYIGDDTWEEEFQEEDYTDYDEDIIDDEENIPLTKKKSKHKNFDDDDFDFE